MESIKDVSQISNLADNKILGKFELINSEIKFYGANNLIFCEDNIIIKNSDISFVGNNSILYLSHTQYGDYNMLNVIVRNDSTIFVGRDNQIGTQLQINIQEHQNLIIGDDGIIGNSINIRTCDTIPVYDVNSKERVNFSESIFIGDHVWIDHFSYISRGAKIGSGAIVGIHTVIPPNHMIKSNNYVMGNPAQVVDDGVFFTKDFTGSYNAEDTLTFSSYKSDVFCFENEGEETLDMDRIDKILKDLTVDDRLEFIQKLFVRNKRRNRFSI